MDINPRILGACFIGTILIVFAFFSAPEQKSAETLNANGTITTEAPKREYIEIGDHDNDGIPDWSESFRQAEVVSIENDTLGNIGDAYEPPDTLTGQLAVNMFTNMVEGQTRGALGPSQEDILNKADQRMAEAAEDALYTLSALTITSSSETEVLHVYGNRLAEILVTYLPSEEIRNEVDIIQHSVQSQKPEILEELTPIINAYSTIIVHLINTPVPSVVAQDHLNIVNSFNAILIDIQGMKMTYTDPVYTIVRMQRYYDDTVGRNNAIVNTYNTLGQQGVIWKEEDMVSKLISF